MQRLYLQEVTKCKYVSPPRPTSKNNIIDSRVYSFLLFAEVPQKQAI